MRRVYTPRSFMARCAVFVNSFGAAAASSSSRLRVEMLDQAAPAASSPSVKRPRVKVEDDRVKVEDDDMTMH